MVVLDPIEEFLKHLYFWDEIEKDDWEDLDFSPFGSATMQLPIFFRDLIENSIQNIAIDDFQYTYACGNSKIRKSIVENFADIAHLKNMDFRKNVSVSLGATAITQNIIESLILDPTDEGIFFQPHYPLHFMGMKPRGKPILCDMKFNETTEVFEIDFDDLRSKLSEKTKFVMLCNPNNPILRVFREEEYLKLTQILEKYPSIRIIEDCSYCVYISTGIKMRYFHEFNDNWNKTYTVFSLGKIFNTTGNRLGFTFATQQLNEILYESLKDYNFPGALDQQIYSEALAQALNLYHEKKTYWEYIAEDVNSRIEYVAASMKGLGIKTYPYDGTYYLLFDSSMLAKHVESRYFYTLGKDSKYDKSLDKAVCRKLITEFKIGMIPLSAMYVTEPKYDTFIRIACNRSYSDLDWVLKSLKSIIDHKNN